MTLRARRQPVQTQRAVMPRTGPSTLGAARDLGHAHVVGSRERCHPRTAADGKSVTESNLSLGRPGKISAERFGCGDVLCSAAARNRRFCGGIRSCPGAAIWSVGGSRDPGEVVAAELVTLVPAAWDLRLRNRPAAALT